MCFISPRTHTCKKCQRTKISKSATFFTCWQLQHALSQQTVHPWSHNKHATVITGAPLRWALETQQHNTPHTRPLLLLLLLLHLQAGEGINIIHPLQSDQVA